MGGGGWGKLHLLVPGSAPLTSAPSLALSIPEGGNGLILQSLSQSGVQGDIFFRSEHLTIAFFNNCRKDVISTQNNLLNPPVWVLLSLWITLEE